MRACVGVAVIALALIPATARASASATDAPTPLPLSAPGGAALVDRLGRHVELRGLNLVAKCPAAAAVAAAPGLPCSGPGTVDPAGGSGAAGAADFVLTRRASLRADP